MKKIISIILMLSSLLLIHVQGFCEEAPKVYSLSLKQAKEMAVEYSPELDCWDVNKQNLQIQLNSARIAQKDNKNTPVYVSQNYDLIFVKEGYYVESFLSQLRLADIERKKIISTIEYDVIQKYYNAKNASKMCEISYASLARAEENQNIIHKQFELGMCTEQELRNAQIAVKQCKATVDKCINSLTLAEDSLRIVLGIEEDITIILTDEISYTDFEANLDEDISKCLTNRYDIQALNENANLSKMYLEIVSGLNQKSSTYFSAYTNKVKAEHNLLTGNKNISLLIKNAYYSVIDARNNTDMAKEKLDFAKDNYEINKIRYELGMITGLVLSSSSDELTMAENTYENALLTQKLAVEKYYYEVAIGL